MSSGQLTITGATFSNNSAMVGAGGSIASTGTLSIAASTFTGDSALGTSGQGGSINNTGALALMNDSFTGDSASGSGGALYNDAATAAQITDSTFSTNSAASGGALENASALTIMGTTLSGNSATTGGAVGNTGTLSATNSTVASNSATAGGGLFNMGTLTLMNATIAYNTETAVGSGGGLDLDAGTAALYNTLVALNTDGGTTADDIAGTVTAASANNLVDDASSAGGLTGGMDGNLVGVLPGIAPALANNGGPTMTIALEAGSPAIDAGNDSLAGVPTVDQRGALRGPAGLNAGDAVDIGAYEASSSYGVSLNTDTNEVGTLRTAVGWANVSTNANPANIASPAPDTVIFSTTGTINLTGGTLALANSGSTAVAKAIVGPGASNLTIDGGNIAGVFSVAGGVTASMSGLTIMGGLSSGSGGGIDNTGSLTLTSIAVAGNAAGTGAGVANEFGGTLVVADSSFASNVATGDGGALSNRGSLELTADTFTGNQAAAGAGIDNLLGGTLTATENTLTSNTATGSGGGIANSGKLTLTDSSLSSNTALTGGGIDQGPGGTMTVINSTLALNSANAGGGVATVAPLTLVNVTIADNVGLLLNTSAAPGAGLDISSGGTVALYNTIVAQNTTGTGALAPANDIATSGGGAVSPASANNLIGTGGSGGLVSGGDTNNLVGVTNPGLAASMAFNGGPTETIALVAGSPAIDAGLASLAGVDIPITDQRGALRGPEGLDAGSAPDIGAYEATSSYLVSTTSDSADVGTIGTAVGWANVSTNVNPADAAGLAPNTVVFESTGLFSTPQTIDLSGGTLDFTNTTTPEAIAAAGSGTLTLSGGGTVGVVSVASGVTATFTGLTFSGGAAPFGGALNNSGNTTLDDDTLSGNSAGYGGAIDNEATGTLTVSNTTFSNNSATHAGGALDNAGVQATLTNTTIAGNTAPLGGGIYNTGPLTLVNDTVAYNSATGSGGGGGLDSGGGSAALYNTIVALNTGGGTTADDISGSVSVTGSHNIIDDASTSDGLVGGTDGNQVGISAGLAANSVTTPDGLASNGGPTQTIALQSGSAALNTGLATITGVNVPTTDQRGAVRNPNKLNGGTTIDVGAYEASSSYLVTTAADNTLSGTLRAAIEWANSNPASSALTGPNTILFDPTVFDTPQTITLSTILGTLELTNTATPEVIDGPGAGLLTIDANSAFGAFSVASGVTATISGATISGGLAESGGGILNQGTLTVNNSTFSNDSALYSTIVTVPVGYGGAIYNDGGTLTVTDSTFTNDVATYGLGGAIDNSGTATISDSTFTGGVAFEGGAIDNKSGSLSVTDSTFNSNTGTQGGAIYNNAAATVTGSTFSNNTAFQGGGIANDLVGNLTLLNSTIADNQAGQNGGGINQAGTLLALSSTIADNFVASGGAGGGIDATSGATTLYNTLVAGNTAGTGTSATASDVSGLLAVASSNNLIATGTGGLTNGVNGNLVGVAKPDIGPLADNGGPTETIALLSGSPAIDAGAASFPIANGYLTAPTTDQRGLRGTAGLNAGKSVDIGAYEASSSYEVTSAADSGDAGTLAAAIGWANVNTNANPSNLANAAPNTVDFGTMPVITVSGGPLVLSNTTTAIAISGPGANVLTIKGDGSSGVLSIGIGVTATISGLTISGGAADGASGTSGSGGAIVNLGTLTLSAMALTGNNAVDGGALANETGATAVLTDSTLSGNSATTGGAIYNAGTLTLTDSTIASNTASNAGGGIFNAGKLTVVSTTIASNSVSSSGTGGGIDTPAGTVALYDTIVAQNTVAATPSFINDIAGTVSSASSNNVIGSEGSGGLVNGTNSNQIVSDASAGLGTLSYNGGDTETIALLTGSPAINAGSSSFTGATFTVPATDQRGAARPTTGAIDVGAVQYVNPTATVVKPVQPIIIVTPVAPPVTTITTTAPPSIATVTVPIVSPASTAAVSTPAVTVTKPIKKTAASKEAHPNGGAAAKFHKTVHTSKPKAKATAHKTVVKPTHTAVAKPHVTRHLPKK